MLKFQKRATNFEGQEVKHFKAVQNFIKLETYQIVENVKNATTDKNFTKF